MKRWRIVAAATFAVGCTAQVGPSPGAPTGSMPGAGSTGSPGAAGSTGSPGAAGSTGSPGAGGSGVGVAGSTGTAGSGVTGLPCTPGLAVTSQVPRLSNVQYDQTIFDLLGLRTLTAANNSPPSTILATDQAGALTNLGWSSYQSVAEMIATQVIADATLKRNFMKCTPTGDGKACLHDTILQFGRRAFRRPLTTEEVARFDKIVTDGPMITESGTIDQIAQTVLYMFLISPSFLQRGEITETSDGAGRFVLSNHEIAARLSYMLWGSIPDDPLSTAADQNQLSTPAQILTQAQRMMMNDKARLKTAEFHRYYVLMGENTRWDTVMKDSARFPAFTSSAAPSLIGDTEKFFDGVVFAKQGSFQDLLLSPLAYVNSATAPLYGLSASGFTTDFKETTLNAAQRPGFLTRVGFLNAYAFYNRTSPIHRGAFIAKQILGTPINTPPPGAEATELPPSSATLDTNRKQVQEQTKGGVCETCHYPYINPAGFAMEAFDAVGTWQTTEALTGAAIDTTADIVIDGVSVHVTGPADLMAKIAASPMAQRRYAQKLVSFAFEREADPLDCGTVNDLAAKIAPGGYKVVNLMTDLTQAPSFRTRAVGVTQ
jgi:hypothetical protein